MNKGLQKEISLLTGLSALAFLLNGRRRLAVGSGLLALGLEAYPKSGISFRNQSVVITGGSRGLGLALAEQLVAEGALVTLLARDQEELQRASKHLDRFRGVPSFTVVCDVNNRNQLKSAFAKVQEQFERIDILINNAGSVAAGPFEAMSQSDFEAQMNLHFFAPLKATQVLLPIFKSQGGGRIVNISSIGGKIPVPHMSSYCSSKYALSGFSQTISAELKKDNITVTTIYPGLMRTGSPIQGVFKGDSEKEFAWFAISDSTPGLTLSADRAAHKILTAVRHAETNVVLGLPAKFGSFAFANFPETVEAIMSLINRVLPQNTSENRRTGAASQSWISEKIWAKPFLNLMKKAQSRFNEHEKFDADFNLNLESSMDR